MKRNARHDSQGFADLEEALDLYENGKVRFRGANLHGKMHGPWEFFRRDGSRMRSGSFEHGKQIGVWRTFDRSGKVLKETEFRAAAPQAGASVKGRRPSRSPRP
jgi:antitoxin component YwqK of YwqJK toxin-antitoxin module